MKKLFIIILTLLKVSGSNAKEPDTLKVEPVFNADLVSRYVWRGKLLSTSPAIQPTLGLECGNLSLGTWASYTFSQQQFQEVDLYASYSYSFFSIGLNDYFSPIDTGDARNKYFDYKNATTQHSLEAELTISDIPNIPLYITATTFFYGNDKDPKGKNYNSAYIELGYNFTLKNLDCSLFGGITPYEGYYATKLAFVNFGFTAKKDLKITQEFSLPFTGSFLLNPDAGNVYFVLGITF